MKNESAASNESTEDQDTNLESTDDQKVSDESTDDQITLTKSDLDRLIGEKVFKALKTREEKENERLSAEKEAKLVLENNYKQLSEEYKGKLEELKKEKERSEFENQIHTLVSDHNLPGYLPLFLKMDNIDLVKESIDIINKNIDNNVESKINERIKTSAPNKTNGAVLNTKVSDMTPEQWAQSDTRKQYWGTNFPKNK